MFQAGAPSLTARRSPPPPPPPPPLAAAPTPPRHLYQRRRAVPRHGGPARPGPRCPPLPTGQRLRSPPTALRRLAGRSRCAAPAALRSAPLAACAGARLGAVAVTPHAQPRSGAAGAEGGAGAGRGDPAAPPPAHAHRRPAPRAVAVRGERGSVRPVPEFWYAPAGSCGLVTAQRCAESTEWLLKVN
ncbi:transcription initiation factor TFIID subunit 4-like [Malurus melanocephalus]|uniref:transcription initiation factor TFIID subunit 4-like n=1 Tax=Malurus melanocephalus TaxID=175006 RepID=UPI002546EDA2|nr:transcription initiation factor TFIID subunit 4-like [Malurus melanocephalus]